MSPFVFFNHLSMNSLDGEIGMRLSPLDAIDELVVCQNFLRDFAPNFVTVLGQDDAVHLVSIYTEPNHSYIRAFNHSHTHQTTHSLTHTHTPTKQFTNTPNSSFNHSLKISFSQ